MYMSLKAPSGHTAWYRLLPATAITLMAFTAPSASFAQAKTDDTDSRAIEEIVTTARRREENVQEVPVAVTTLSADELQDYNVLNLSDISNIVPNSVISAGRATNSTIIAYVRGIGQNDPLWGFEPGVGLYLDDVFLARPQGALLDVYDVKSIEVLRGPQGTLYGKNTLAGAIKYNSRDIVGDPYARATVEAGNYNRLDLKISGSTPVTDTFYVGGALAYLTRDGYGEVVESETPQLYNQIGDDVSNKDLLAARLNATLLIGDASRLSVAYDTVEDNSNARGSKRMNNSWGEPLDSRYDVLNDMPVGLDKVKNWGVSAHFDSTLNDSWSLKLIGAHRKNESDTFIDFEALNSPIFNVVGAYNDDQSTFEAQLNYQNNDWAAVMGAFYFDGNACGGFDAVLGLYNLTSLTDGCVGTKGVSVYGDATWSINDKWNLSFGGRWNKDDKTANVYVAQYLGTLNGSETFLDRNNPPDNLTLLGVQSDYTNSKTFDDFTPRLSLDYAINDNAMAYASYTNGFKSGGFDMRGNESVFPGTSDGYDSESVDSYEIGLKTTSLDGALLFNITAFYADYTDVQITTQEFVLLNGVPTNATAVLNAGKQINQGVELETVWKASDYVHLSAVLGFLNADITEFLTADPANPGEKIDISGTVDPLFSPDFTALANAEFFWPMGRGDGYGRISYAYTDDVKVANLIPSTGDQSAFGLLNATMAYTTEDGKWRFALNGSNLTDEDYLQAGYDFGAAINYVSQIGFYGAPRTFSVSATFTY
ncbi:MAG: TonB-dependent receptor [Gammaproteobacteria bacterium]|nr:TonB-dependent receptor [Gammaproteobacteria bacterium]